MRYDIILVLYNSAKWLPGCIDALANQDYNLEELCIIAVDNNSSDNSAELYKSLTSKYMFGSAKLISNQKNKGFGAACNLGAKAGDSPFLFFLNVDTQVFPDIFKEIDAGISQHNDAGAFECRQFPYDMGHHVDPVTLETPWASGAALVVKREVFNISGGFDHNIFMYCEDVDLSWRIRATGSKICFLPKAALQHFVLDRTQTKNAGLGEYSSSELGRLLLAYKYGSLKNIIQANKRYINEIKSPQHFDNVRKVFAKNYIRHLAKLWPFLFWRFRNKTLFKNSNSLYDPEFAPERGRDVLDNPIINGPMISVVIRTHKRPQALRGALQSIANQTYNNYEVIVVEDGEDCSRAMVEAEFSHLPIRYYATGENIGRGKAGNLGLSKAKGDYLNFLDDDDYFYPDHLELMAQKSVTNPDADIILGCAMVMKVDIQSKDPYKYIIRELYPMRFDRLDIFTMCQTCQIPIQSAMFKRSLFEELGGLREDIEGHEDWAMWMKFLATAKRIDPKHIDIHRATSIFLLPATPENEQKRIDKYKIYDKIFFNDPSVSFQLSIADLRGFYDDIIADTLHLKNTGKLEEYLNNQIKTRNR